MRFEPAFPQELIESFKEIGFLGLCAKVVEGADARSVFLHPTPHEYTVLTLQLRELKSQGALSFDEPAP